MSHTYTKGPWQVDEVSEDNAGHLTLGITSGNRPGYICGIHCAEGVDLDVIDKANAQLIAAAPDLLAALENLAEKSDLILSEINSFDSGWYYQFQAAVQQARNALAKATGDQQGKENPS